MPSSTPSRTPSGNFPLGNLTGTYRASMAERVRIGRAPDNDVVVNDLLVSRFHAEVVLTAEHGYEIVDLKSHNGTFVDGQRVTTARIDEASVIGFGITSSASSAARWSCTRTPAVSSSRRRTSRCSLPGDVRSSTRSASSCRRTASSPSSAQRRRQVHADEGPDRVPALGRGGGALRRSGPLQPSRRAATSHRVRPQDDVLHPQLTVRRALEFAAELRFPSDVSARSAASGSKR